MLSQIPETERKSRDTSAYPPGRWAPSTRISPFMLRKRCADPTAAWRTAEESDPDDEDDNGDATNPSGYIQTPSNFRPTEPRSKTSQRGQSSGGRYGQSSSGSVTSLRLGSSIEHRPYCTQNCLLGLRNGLQLDPGCPNVAAHGQKHISLGMFLQLLRKQLAVDRGPDADCLPLYVHGSRGALLKVCLTSHGYTLVAKGVESRNIRQLEHEKRVYDRLQTLQGRYVPICCGISVLDTPYFYDGIELKRVLLMSWGGRSLVAIAKDKRSLAPTCECSRRMLSEALVAIHAQGVLHHDAEPRNVLYDNDTDRWMIVDFERSEFCGRRPLGELSSNRKRKYGKGGKTAVDRFETELYKADYKVRRAF